MASVARMSSVVKALPEEVQSFQNIQSTFPSVYTEGLKLLAELAGKIQLMRLETELFPTLKVEETKDAIKAHEKVYREVKDLVETYRETLESVNGQISRAIQLCSEVPQKDIRSFSDKDKEVVKVYEFCQRILPSLHDMHSQGLLLEKRIRLVLTQDYKHYNESIVKFTQVINPSSWTFTGIASSLSSLLFTQGEATQGDLGASALQGEKKK